MSEGSKVFCCIRLPSDGILGYLLPSLFFLKRTVIFMLRTLKSLGKTILNEESKHFKLLITTANWKTSTYTHHIHSPNWGTFFSLYLMTKCGKFLYLYHKWQGALYGAELLQPSQEKPVWQSLRKSSDLTFSLLPPPSLSWLPLLCHYKGASNANVVGLLPWLARLETRKKQLKTFFCSGLQILILMRVSGENSWRLDRVATGHYFCPQAGQKSRWERLFAHWQDLWWYLKGGSCRA